MSTEERLRAALRTIPARPDGEVPQARKRKYSEDMSALLALAFAAELRQRGMAGARPAPRDVLGKSGAERRMAGGIGAKKVDVTWATEESGLIAAITIKTINFKDGRTKNYQKNLTNRRNEMLFESVTLHRRFPYAVILAVLVLPEDALNDGTKGRENTVANAHTIIKLFTGRDDPQGRDEQYERFYIALHVANETMPRLRFYEAGNPEDELGVDKVFDDLMTRIVERNPDMYRVREGTLVRLHRSGGGSGATHASKSDSDEAEEQYGDTDDDATDMT